MPTKVHLVKAMVFPVVMDGYESWTIKKAECERIDAFELWCWRRLLRVPWTARRSNKSILKEISPGCSLEGLILKLKLQYFGYLMQRANSLEKTLMLGNIECRRRRGRQDEMVGWHHRLDGHEFGWTPGVGDGQECLAWCSSWGCKESDTTEWLNWTEKPWALAFSWPYSVGKKVKVTQSCLTLCDPMDYTVHGILQARIQEWVAFLFSRESSQQGSNLGLPHCSWIHYQLSHKGNLRILEWVAYPFSSGCSWPRNQF